MSVYISPGKKLIHAMSLDIDQLINRAVVVGCAISATRNYLKLHMSRTLKVLLCNTHAATQKLWKRSSGLPPLEPMPSINPPDARCCTPRARRDARTLLGSPVCRRARPPRAGVASTIEIAAHMQSS
jgi:hypothetical protein